MGDVERFSWIDPLNSKGGDGAETAPLGDGYISHPLMDRTVSGALKHVVGREGPSPGGGGVFSSIPSRGLGDRLVKSFTSGLSETPTG